MSIVFDEKLDLFHLETEHTSYVIGLADKRTYPSVTYIMANASACRICVIFFALENHRMYLRRITESAVPFMTRSRLNIPETESEITERVRSR